MAKSFSNKSNAVRGFRQHFPKLAANLSYAGIAMDFLDTDNGRYSINLEVVAEYQRELAGKPVVTAELAGVPMLSASVVRTGAVARAHAVFGALPAGTQRKAAIAAAVDAGIAFYTARTQYQAWRKAA